MSHDDDLKQKLRDVIHQRRPQRRHTKSGKYYEIETALNNDERLPTIALCCSEMLNEERGHGIICFVTNQRSAKCLIQMINELVCNLNGSIVSVNKAEQLVYKTCIGNENSVHVFPSKPETLRGAGFQYETGTVILAHAQQIDDYVYHSIVEPSLERTGINVVSINTATSGKD